MEQEQVFGKGSYEWTYGKRNDKKLTLWPLTFGDQMTISNIVIEALTSLTKTETGGDAELIAVALRKVYDNFPKIAALAAGLPEDDEQIVTIIDNMTNAQFMDFANYLWHENYGSVRKNYDSLIKELANLIGMAK